jgi:hypothetical protein
VPLFVFTLNGQRARVNELLPPLMKQRGNFIERWNPNGWIWRPVPRSSSAWICFSKPRNFASVCHRLIYVPIVMNECRLKPSKRPLNLKNTPSNVEIAAPSIRGVFALMTSRVDGASVASVIVPRLVTALYPIGPRGPRRQRRPRESGNGTELPTRDVRSPVGYCGQSGQYWLALRRCNPARVVLPASGRSGAHEARFVRADRDPRATSGAARRTF